jgi:hypothetical protein
VTVLELTLKPLPNPFWMERGRFVRRGKPGAIFADFSTVLAIPGEWNGSNEQKKYYAQAV